MKKIYLLLMICFIALNFISCKKKDPLDIDLGTIKTNIGSGEKTFSINAKATRLNVNGGYGIEITGYYRTGSTTNLTFVIVGPNPIIANTYTENPGGNPLVTMKHCVEVIVPCVIQTSEHGSATNPVSVTIREITSTYVKGTFKGELQTPLTSGAPSTEVFSNGVFYVSF